MALVTRIVFVIRLRVSWALCMRSLSSTRSIASVFGFGFFK